MLKQNIKAQIVSYVVLISLCGVISATEEPQGGFDVGLQFKSHLSWRDGKKKDLRYLDHKQVDKNGDRAKLYYLEQELLIKPEDQLNVWFSERLKRWGFGTVVALLAGYGSSELSQEGLSYLVKQFNTASKAFKKQWDDWYNLAFDKGGVYKFPAKAAYWGTVTLSALGVGGIVFKIIKNRARRRYEFTALRNFLDKWGKNKKYVPQTMQPFFEELKKVHSAGEHALEKVISEAMKQIRSMIRDHQKEAVVGWHNRDEIEVVQNDNINGLLEDESENKERQ